MPLSQRAKAVDKVHTLNEHSLLGRNRLVGFLCHGGCADDSQRQACTSRRLGAPPPSTLHPPI